MSWARQVVHVIAKDVRQWQVMYFMLSAVVLVATLHASGLFAEAAVFDASVAFVILAGMLTIACSVQGDSPTRVDAFWASRPLRSSAVVCAKFAQAVIIIAIPLIGQFIALTSRGIPGLHAVQYLPESIALFGLWIAGALVSAALTKDIQGAIVWFLTVVALFGLTLVTLGDTPSLSSAARQIIGVLECGLALGAVWLLYSKRHRPRWLAAVGGVAMLAPLVAFMPGRRDPWVTEATNKGLRFAVADTLGLDRPSIPINLFVEGIKASQQATLNETLVSITLKDGRNIDVGRYVVPLAIGDEIPTPVPVRWIGYKTGASLHKTSTFSFSLQPQEREVIRRVGARAIRISGVLTVSESRILDTFELRSGVQRHIGDMHLLVKDVSLVNNDVKLEMNLTAPHKDNSADPYGVQPAFVLLNEMRGEAIAISGNNMMTSNSWLVMPGITISDQTFNLSLRNPIVEDRLVSVGGRIQTSSSHGSSVPIPPNVDAAWLSSAKAMLVGWTLEKHSALSASLDLH